ncbi:helix-turn-helix transcriptional regulator [Bacillus shackletonii]|nr:helix-turn-helix transcriptional regulator [Heyndrickxia shackletonii]
MEGAISKHLKQLRDAGLITTKPDSYYVFYQLLEQPFEEFPNNLMQFIR